MKKDSAGDFGNAVYLSLKSRCKDQGDLTISQINKALDELNISLERFTFLSLLPLFSSSFFLSSLPLLLIPFILFYLPFRKQKR